MTNFIATDANLTRYYPIPSISPHTMFKNIYVNIYGIKEIPEYTTLRLQAIGGDVDIAVTTIKDYSEYYWTLKENSVINFANNDVVAYLHYKPTKYGKVTTRTLQCIFNG